MKRLILFKIFRQHFFLRFFFSPILSLALISYKPFFQFNTKQLSYFYFNYFSSSNFFNKKKIVSTNYFFFFDYFLKNFFSFKIKNNCLIKFKTFNYFFFEQNTYLNWILVLLKKNNAASLINFLPLKNIIEIFLIFFIKKDVSLLSNWLKNTMEGIYYKNHKKFLNLFKMLFSFLFKYLNSHFLVKGIFFRLKGKIGLGGNSKKKKFNLNLGSFSLSKKFNKIDYSKNSIKTVSGMLGFCLFIFF